MHERGTGGVNANGNERLTLDGDGELGDRSCSFAYCAKGMSAWSLGSGSRMSCTVSPEPCANITNMKKVLEESERT